MGAKVLAQYAVLGQYDFINIVEAPNNDAIVVSLELASRGTLHITFQQCPLTILLQK